MSKFEAGDIAIITRNGFECGQAVRIKGWRGGRVAPYVVEYLDSGKISYFSGRDMEHRDMSMSGKHKVYCVHSGCSTYSFESVAILQWQCFRHYPNHFNKSLTSALVVCAKEKELNTRLTTEEKLDLLLEYLGLTIETEPKIIKVKEQE